MTKLSAILLILYSAASVAKADVVASILIADDSECTSSRMVFANDQGYIHAEWYGGFFWKRGVYFGDFHSFGMTDVLDNDGDRVGRVWVDDYWMSQSSASEYCYRD